MNTMKLMILLLLFSCFGAATVHADDNYANMKKELSEFFKVSADRINIECPQKSYELTGQQSDQILNICLHKADNQKRCEITISGIDRAPVKHHISYELNFSDPNPRKRWESIMQIHSFPDKGEAWRCPVASFEVKDGLYRMYNRWDASPISRTLGYNCAEQGSSISSRTIINDVKVKAGQWQKIVLDAGLSTEDGEFRFSIDDKVSPDFKGPNTFNDERQPYLKFGIYKPTGWENDHVTSCVKYRNVKIVTGDN